MAKRPITEAIPPEGEKSTGRLEAFSDGVFAIAITLLVLELKVPHLASGAEEPTSRALAASLLAQWPGYLAFVTSFLSILIMWMHHHTLFRWVQRTDASLLFANGALLLVVSVVPFPTAVLSEYLGTGASTVACEFYCGVLLLISLAFYFLLLAALRSHVLSPGVPHETLRRWRRSYRLGPPGYLVAVLCSPFSAWLSMGICTVLWILWAAMTRTECAEENTPEPARLGTATGLHRKDSAGLDTRA